MNPNDPIPKVLGDAGKELFEKLSRQASGYPTEAVLNAAAMLLVNGVRQSRASRREAELAFDELVAKAKSFLLEKHYDSLGRKKGIFPYPQMVVVESVLSLKRH